MTERLHFTFHFHALEKEMATHSSVLAWRISGTGKPGGLPSMGSHRVGHDWSDLAAAMALAYLQDKFWLLTSAPEVLHCLVRHQSLLCFFCEHPVLISWICWQVAQSTMFSVICFIWKECSRGQKKNVMWFWYAVV